MKLTTKFLAALFVLPFLSACHSEEDIKKAIYRCSVDNFSNGISPKERDCKDPKNYEKFFK